jgi:hypothetical protein
MDVLAANEIELPSEDGYGSLLQLQNEINTELQRCFEHAKCNGREHLATVLIGKVEDIVGALNELGYGFNRTDYGGDINYEDSYQMWCNRQYSGICISFHGFSAQVSWSDPGA